MTRGVIFLFILAAVFLFVLQNMQIVEVKFLLWTITLSRALILFITFAVGLIGGYILSYPIRRRKTKMKS